MLIRRLFIAVALSLAAAGAMAQDKVVYHFDDAAAQALKGLRNIRTTSTSTRARRSRSVTHANGVDFLMKDAKDRNGNPYAGAGVRRWWRAA